MAKKKKARAGGSPSKNSDKQQATVLGDLLSSDVLAKLKEQSKELKAEEEKKQEEIRKQKAAERKAEQDRLDNDFEHLLKESKLNWKEYK